MDFYWLEESPRSLQRLIGTAASMRQSLRYRTPMRITVDRDGDWINQQRDITLVSPVVHAMPFEKIRENALDLWCHAYRPLPGDTIVDVGAGIGAESIVLSRLVGTTGRVLAIEAHPRTYRCLRKSIRSSRADRVLPVHAAIANQPGLVELSDDAVHIANAIIRSSAHERKTVTVPGFSLDRLLEAYGVDEITLLKMNIEGAEIDALLGATSTLQRTKHVVVSCHDFIAERGGPEWTRTFSRARTLLGDHGFSLKLREDDPRPWVRYTIHAEGSCLSE